MFEYYPWSKQEYQNCLAHYQDGNFSILDIELGGECNYNCVYCDSPERSRKCKISLDDLERLISQNSYRWIYICGLGEPTFKNNYTLLIELLKLCEAYGIHCSIFSNISNLSDELLEYIKKGVLYILFKYDSREKLAVKSLYGITKPDEQLEAIEKLKSCIRREGNTTNVAASIVPTQLNRTEIIPIVRECVDVGIFPLLGELELSGKGQMNYQNLYLNQAELSEIKEKIDEICGETYSIPVCPAVVNGLHFSSDSDITVDAFSGLSCHWFWLKEPQTKKIMHFDHRTSAEEIAGRIFQYRESCVKNVKSFLSSLQSVGGAFGGCGGDITRLFQDYLALEERREK